MLRLIIMRHGQAETTVDVSDSMRKLTRQGQLSARLIGVRLAAIGWIPEIGGVSDAARTLETQAEVAQALPRVVWKSSNNLYLASPVVTANELTVIAANAKTLIVIGHNPGLSDLVERLTAENVGLDPADAALVSIEATTWGEGFELTGCWQLNEVIRSASLRNS